MVFYLTVVLALAYALGFAMLCRGLQEIWMQYAVQAGGWLMPSWADSARRQQAPPLPSSGFAARSVPPRSSI